MLRAPMPDDGTDGEERPGAFAAHRDGLLDERGWLGFERELAYRTPEPSARRAWQAFRQQAWTDGFVDHTDSVHDGAPACPNLQEVCAAEPTVRWPDASDGRPETT